MSGIDFFSSCLVELRVEAIEQTKDVIIMSLNWYSGISGVKSTLLSIQFYISMRLPIKFPITKPEIDELMTIISDS